MEIWTINYNYSYRLRIVENKIETILIIFKSIEVNAGISLQYK